MPEDPFINLMRLKSQGALERFETAYSILREALALIERDDVASLIQAGQLVTQGRNVADDGVRLLDEILTLGKPLPKRKRRTR